MTHVFVYSDSLMALPGRRMATEESPKSKALQDLGRRLHEAWCELVRKLGTHGGAAPYYTRGRTRA